MSQENPTDEQIKAEIAAAVKILKEDGVHIRRTIGDLFAQSKETQVPKPEDESTEGKPPPKKDVPETPPKKSGFWFGTRTDD